MAENKKGFILYADLISIVRKLIIKDRLNKTNYAGELFYAILLYVNDLELVEIDFIVELAFEPIKLQLKRDLKKFEVKRQQYSDAGKASAEARRLKKESEQSLTPLKDVEVRSTNPTVTDTVNVTDIVTVKDIIKKEKAFNFRKSLIDYGFNENLVIDWLKVRKTKKASNTETAFNGFIKQVELANNNINHTLNECVNNSWAGFKSEWLSNTKNSQVKTEKKDAALILQERYGIK